LILVNKPGPSEVPQIPHLATLLLKPFGSLTHYLVWPWSLLTQWIIAFRTEAISGREASMGVIPASINALSNQYPRRDVKDQNKYQYVDQVMKGLKGTPCCVQVSHALNMSGIPVPSRSYRRDPNIKLTINGKLCGYQLATDELEDFLQTRYGEPETINRDLNQTRSAEKIKAYIKDRPGLLIFRHADLRVPPPQDKFEHTEFWNGTQILQRDMAEASLFSSPRVLMWDTNDPAKWLVDYMKTQP
jgi:hypothetical protein